MIATRFSQLLLSLTAAGALSLGVRDAQSCQACVEDKVAATYDWQVIATAKRQGHTVIFTAITGPIAPEGHSMERHLARTLATVPGVDKGTVRISLAPPALAFAADLRRQSVDTLLGAMNQRLRSFGITLTVVRVGAPAGGAPAIALTRSSAK